MIFICGDIHGTVDIKKIELWEKDMCPNRNDYLIVLGDFGAVWYGNWWDKDMIDYWDNKPYRVLFVDGNHENHKALNECPVINWHGGRAHLVGNSVLHLMRGEIFTIEGKTFFTMGGAPSIDRYLRTEGKSWWPEEMPSWEEFENGIDNLAKADYKVDYVLTHTTDTHTLHLINNYYEPDSLTQYLWFLKTECELKYTHHYFGHFHIDQDFGAYETCLYNNIVCIPCGGDSKKS